MRAYIWMDIEPLPVVKAEYLPPIPEQESASAYGPIVWEHGDVVVRADDAAVRTFVCWSSGRKVLTTKSFETFLQFVRYTQARVAAEATRDSSFTA